MSSNVEAVENTNNDDATSDVQTQENVNIAEVVPGYTNFDDYVKHAFGVMKAGIKAANSLPSGENFNYYSCFPKFHEIRNNELKRVLSIMQGVVELSGAAGNVRQRDMEERYELLVEANDIFLDRASVCMDEEEGVPKKPGIALIVSQTNKKNVFGSWNATTATPATTRTNSSSAAPSIRLLAARNVQRPQWSFKDKIDNSTKPWEPRIKDKPNSLKPLAIYLEEVEDGEIFNHPYEFELDKFEPPESQLERCDPIPYKSLEDTPLIVIEKPEDINILLEDLRRYNEIAVDLEHHSYRSFQGITCLMQISTRDTDYLIDTLTLRSELHVLNEIFTKPTVLKVFHGADSDIHWLQRDLSLYVVNMFDTHQAGKQLDLPYLSLAYLLKRHCSLDPNKHFQLADWRIRPLPEELMKYAREDTHYLLYIKDILRNDLIDAANGQTNILKVVYDRSTEICKRVYVKPIWNEESYMSMYRKSQKMFNNRQLYALKELHRWRDETARLEDDSPGYVLPNHMLLNIAETLPREMQGILACCNPIPPLVRQNLLRLHKVILKAREQPLIKPILEQDIRQRLTQRNQAANADAWLYKPHDMPSGMEIRADLPCLLSSEKSQKIGDNAPKIDHYVTVFDGPTGSDYDEALEQRRTLRKKKTLFVSPFERYKRVMPMVAAQEEKERKEQEKEEAERNLAAQKKEEEKTTRSIERVYDHFKNVVQGTSTRSTEDSPSEKKKKNTNVPLGQMHGRKRKRQSDAVDSPVHQEDSKYDALTPKPSLNATVGLQNYGMKRKNEITDHPTPQKEMKYDPAKSSIPKNNQQKQGKKNQKNRIPVKNDAGGQKEPIDRTIISGLGRNKKKNHKQANLHELQQQGMLPQQNFDYQSVDFSSFQGGSTIVDDSKSTQFQQQKQKDKIRKGKKRKKQKISGI